MSQGKKYAVIDVFAGPGGLSEGFIQREKTFGPFVAIEKDPISCRTLKLRKIFHLIKNKKEVNSEYLQFLMNQSNLDEILDLPKHKELKKILDDCIWNHELGTLDSKQTSKEIRKRLKNQGWDEKKNDGIILIGGPPCQAYSLAGRSRRSQMAKSGEYNPLEDERNFLYKKYLDLVIELKPKIFAMENVPGILSARIEDELIFSKILKDLENPDQDRNTPNSFYKLFPLCGQKELILQNKDFSINCQDFGIPQARKRVIVMGIREDLNVNKIPLLKKTRPIFVKDVLKDLPKLRSGISKLNGEKTDDLEDIWKHSFTRWSSKELNSLSLKQKIKFNEFREKILKFDFREGRGRDILRKNRSDIGKSYHSTMSQWIVDSSFQYHLNCQTRSHMNSDLKRYLFNVIFSKLNNKAPLLKDYPQHLLPRHKSRLTGYQDRFRTLINDKPSATITSHISKDGHAFIHPDPLQCRSLTVREAARIQTFPDNYFFSGNRTQQYAQVGNAVPPFLSYQISGIIEEIILN